MQRDLSGGRRAYAFQGLAAAIQRGDRAEADIQLDIIASYEGEDVREHIQRGRFARQAVGA